jgi:hypothetical protein
MDNRLVSGMRGSAGYTRGLALDVWILIAASAAVSLALAAN